ncbi:MAG TPA: ATP-binding protein [Planosporangium sp.]|jgi:anti-sigma regulatory factor (Ser/Thr protein kinase)|nr:ATP-binding protein [Planosporangium sp.]
MNQWTGAPGSAPVDRALTCTVESDYPAAVIRVSGRLDPGGVPDLRACVLDCLAAEPDVIVLDVADLAVEADECVPVFAGLSCQATVWPGSTLVFAHASPALIAAVRRYGADIASYPSVDAARDRVASDSPRHRLRETLPASPVAAPVARRLLDRACRSWSVLELLEPAELVTTELVANAVRHAGSRVMLTVSLHHGHLQISVGDDSRAPPQPRAATPSDEHGRGLLMVEALCEDWGMTCVGGGKVVWAKVAARA